MGGINNSITIQTFHMHQPIRDEEQVGKKQQYELTCYESCLECCGSFQGCLKIWLPCCCCCCNSPVYQIPTSKVGIHQSFGRYIDQLNPGFHLINPSTENVILVDLKTNVFELAPQQVITKDNVSMSIRAMVYYRAINPYKLVYKLRNDSGRIRQFIKEMSYSAMRSVTGQNTFQELLQHRDKIAEQLEQYVKEKLFPYGLYIEHIFIKDLILKAQTQRNMQSAAIQKRVSEATIIEAKANVQAAKMLKQTSQILQSQSAMQIRFLEAVQNISDRCGAKVMFMNLKGKE